MGAWALQALLPGDPERNTKLGRTQVARKGPWEETPQRDKGADMGRAHTTEGSRKPWAQEQLGGQAERGHRLQGTAWLGSQGRAASTGQSSG